MSKCGSRQCREEYMIKSWFASESQRFKKKKGRHGAAAIAARAANNRAKGCSYQSRCAQPMA